MNIIPKHLYCQIPLIWCSRAVIHSRKCRHVLPLTLVPPTLPWYLRAHKTCLDLADFVDLAKSPLTLFGRPSSPLRSLINVSLRCEHWPGRESSWAFYFDRSGTIYFGIQGGKCSSIFRMLNLSVGIGPQIYYFGLSQPVQISTATWQRYSSIRQTAEFPSWRQYERHWLNIIPKGSCKRTRICRDYLDVWFFFLELLSYLLKQRERFAYF